MDGIVGDEPKPLLSLIDSRVEVNLLDYNVAKRLALESKTLAITINVFNSRPVKVYS